LLSRCKTKKFKVYLSLDNDLQQLRTLKKQLATTFAGQKKMSAIL